MWCERKHVSDTGETAKSCSCNIVGQIWKLVEDRRQKGGLKMP